MTILPNLSFAGMSVPRQVLAAARFLPAAFEAIKSRRLSVPASFFVAGPDGRTLGISKGDVVLTAPSADLERIQTIIINLEDRRFHRHRGIDVRGIVRASIANARAMKVVQGGSTLTQQLVRNTLLAPDRTPVRKLCEMFLAVLLERYYSKSEILDLYCHHVFLGAGTRGFPAAAKLLYRRPVAALDDERLVALAGLLRAPSRTHPATNPEAFVSRARTLQKRPGTAAGSGKVVPANPADSRRLPRSRHTTQIRSELHGLGCVDRDVARVTTSVQAHIQAALNDALASAFQDRKVRASAGVVLDIRSSEVLAESSWVDGKESEFSVALRGCVQPGSTFKPIAVLAALDQGFTINQQLESSPFESAELGARRGKPWRVRNYAHVYGGRVTLLEALRSSDNTAFARLAEMLDRDALSRTYQRLRLCHPSEVTPAIVLGAHRAGVGLAALANAYAAIARGGVFLPYRLVRCVEFRDGTFHAPPRAAGEVVVRDYSVVAAVRDALTQCGTRVCGAVFAGKTGTTSLGSLFAAYDDHQSYAVWLAFRDPIPEVHAKAMSAVDVFERLVRRVLGAPSGVLSIV